MSKFQQLQQMLQNISVSPQPQPYRSTSGENYRIQQQYPQPSLIKSNTQKPRLNSLHHLVDRLTIQFDETCNEDQNKFASLINYIRKIEDNNRQNMDKVQSKYAQNKNMLSKLDKNMKRIQQRLQKERKESQKKIQMSLENYLIELNSLKGKTHMNCQTNIKKMKSLQQQLQYLNKQAESDSARTKDLLKKVYAQFTSQIQQLQQLIQQQQIAREKQQELILQLLKKVYERVKTQLKKIKQNRQKNEKQALDLLQKIIQKVKIEFTR